MLVRFQNYKMNFKNTFKLLDTKIKENSILIQKSVLMKKNYDIYNYDLLLKKGFTLNYYEQQKFQREGVEKRR